MNVNDWTNSPKWTRSPISRAFYTKASQDDYHIFGGWSSQKKSVEEKKENVKMACQPFCIYTTYFLLASFHIVIFKFSITQYHFVLAPISFNFDTSRHLILFSRLPFLLSLFIYLFIYFSSFEWLKIKLNYTHYHKVSKWVNYRSYLIKLILALIFP